MSKSYRTDLQCVSARDQAQWSVRRVIYAVLTGLFAWFFAVQSAAAEACPARPSAKIVGGTLARAEDWPAQVVFRLARPSSEYRYFCGGTVIAARWVLTAAHCFHPDKFSPSVRDNRIAYKGRDPIQAVIGVADVRDVPSANVFGVESIQIHQGYEPNVPGSANDIALVKLASRWEGPVMALGFAATSDPTRDDCLRVAGFGAVSEGSGTAFVRDRAGAAHFAGSIRLQEVALPYVTPRRCASAYEGASLNDVTQLCAGFDIGLRDSCQGDSGGPLIAYQDGQPYQVGVVSFGRGCAQPKAYGVYTRISAFAPWIRERVPEAFSYSQTEGRKPRGTKSIVAASFDQMANTLAPAKGRLSVAISAGSRLSVSEGLAYSIEVKSTVSGRLYLFDVDAEGNLTQIFPNSYVRAGDKVRVEANAPVRVPDAQAGMGFTFRAVPPFGASKLMAIVTPEDFPAQQLMMMETEDGPAKGLAAVESPGSFAMNMASAVESTAATTKSGTKLKGFAMNIFDYEIVP